MLQFSNPASSRRDHLTVRISYDEGRSWPIGRLIEEGSSAYSCLTRLKDGRIGILYERDDYRKLTFAAFSPAWIRRAEFEREQATNTLQAAFQPPAGFANDFGDYRSPLIDTDGKRVSNADQWKQRRRQITRRRWL